MTWVIRPDDVGDKHGAPIKQIIANVAIKAATNR
jgi:hypothetical protein